VTCPPTLPVCIVVVTGPGAPGGGGSGGGGKPTQPNCTVPGTTEVVPCYDPTLGWWDQADGCYYQMLAPQPPPSAVVWQGHYPAGSVYEATCLGVAGTGGGWRWFPTPPQGFGGTGLTPAVLAQQALSRMRLSPPGIGMAPSPGSTGLVGLPVWLWTAPSATTWGPVSATAAVPGLSVTATARVRQISWAMGDGDTVACTTPGTPYTPSLGSGPSPTCGYVYPESSHDQPGGVFVVTATTTWAVTWAGGGQSGALTVTRTSTTDVRISELQVLVS